MQMEELEKRTSQLQMEADGLMKAQQALYVPVYTTCSHCVLIYHSAHLLLLFLSTGKEIGSEEHI